VINEGVEKIIVDVPASIKEKLKELAYRERGTMKSVIERLIEEEWRKGEK
jgi:hypothetical protein